MFVGQNLWAQDRTVTRWSCRPMLDAHHAIGKLDGLELECPVWAFCIVAWSA